MTGYGVALAAGIALLVLALTHLRRRRETALLRARLETALADLERLEGAFTRFAPHDVVERIIRSGVPATGERREVTALFSDLVGFTELSQRIDPTVLVRVLNGYFNRMSRAITGHRGHVSTLMGDGMLALFAAHESNPWQSDDAARAALDMRAALALYNGELREQGLPELAFGVGLHRSEGIAGVVGSLDRMEFAVVGGPVNLAARLQALTRDLGTDVLVSSAVHAALDPRFALREMPPAPLRGFAEPIVTWALDRLEA